MSIVHGESRISPHKQHYMASSGTSVATRGLQTTEVLPGRVNSIHAITACASTATVAETSDYVDAAVVDAADAVGVDADTDSVVASSVADTIIYTSMAMV